MRALPLAIPLALASMAAAPAIAQQAPPAALTTPQAQASYVIGLNLGAGMRNDGLPLDDADAFVRGVRDALAKAKPAMSDDQISAVTIRLQADIAAKRAQSLAEAAETNKTEGPAFLKANRAKPGVITLPDGLQYQIVTAGKGPKPKASDTVSCNYRGTLIDGTEFDSSASHGGPSSFPVQSVIPGWTEALLLMPVGSRWKLFIPADLAYGGRSPDPSIAPNATLIFDIELLSITKG